MFINTDIFKIESNRAVPSRGKLLVAEPFLCDQQFARSVVLLTEHARKGSMGLMLNKPLPVCLNELMEDIDCKEQIPVFRGGPINTDTLFYLHTLKCIPGSLPIAENVYLNGDFPSIKQFVSEGNTVEGNIRFFLGYSGWEFGQLAREIEENSWLVCKADAREIMAEQGYAEIWKESLCNMGGKYEVWSRFPQAPTLN